MKAEDVDAALVARAEAAREDALRKWHIKFRAGQQTEPGHVLGMRAALAAVLPEIQAQAWDAAIEVALTVRPEMGLHINVSEYRQGKVDGLDIAVANMRAARARLTATTEEPTDG